MKNKRKMQDKAAQLLGQWVMETHKEASLPPPGKHYRRLQELFLEMAEFAQQNTQTAQERQRENLKAYHRIAGE